MLLKCCLCRTLFCHADSDVEYVHNSIWEGKPADSGPYTGALVAGLRHVGPTCLLEEDLGSDGKAGTASNSRSCVILTTQTGCLMTGSNNNHTQTDRHKKLCCVIISPKQEKTKLITAISERGEREKGGERREKKWEESEKTRSWRLWSTAFYTEFRIFFLVLTRLQIPYPSCGSYQCTFETCIFFCINCVCVE